MGEFNDKLRYKINAPLNNGDTESTTFGCRHSNPDICSSCYLPDICAFTSKDSICKRPSKKWIKIYQGLREKENENL